MQNSSSENFESCNINVYLLTTVDGSGNTCILGSFSAVVVAAVVVAGADVVGGDDRVVAFSTGTQSPSFALCWDPLDTGNCKRRVVFS